jgi:outer membrane protein OmpA-like peptidoglycan-associated protein
MLAESYAKTGDVEKAEKYYATVVNSPEKTPTDILGYVAVLSKNGNYEAAEKWMGEYASLSPDDGRAKQYKSHPGFYKDLQKDFGKYSIKNIAANTPQEDFSPSYYKDKVVFASSREGTVSIKRSWNWNGLPFLDTYIASASEENELSNIEQFDKKINNKYHDGPVSFNQAGDFMVFTRNNYNGRSGDGVIKLQLFSSELTAGKWSKEKALPYNSSEYSVGHASLSPDGKTMYFASDMPGGKGGVDIYKSTRSEEGTWGEAENLGDKINTEGNEMFPFIHANQEMLFFASDGHLGLGGLDVFIAEVKDKGNAFGKVENVGVPINGSKDDFSLILDQEMKKGYFASNRLAGKGDDDIYSFNLLKPFNFGKTIKGVAKDKQGTPLADTKINLYNSKGEVIETALTGTDGAYSFSVDPDKEFSLTGTKDKYFEGKNTASTKTDEPVVIADLTLEKDPGLSLYTLIQDAKTKAPLAGVQMTIIDNLTNTEFINVVTPASGDALKGITGKKVVENISYNIVLAKQGYFTRVITFNHKITKPGIINVHEFLKGELGDGISLDKEVADLAQMVEINPINFDYDKYNIRKDAATELDKIVTVMNKYPGMVIELGSHTDSRGSDAYNKKLSDRRAKASASYIKKKIADGKRIYGKGYGETKLINRCTNGVKCSDQEHENNRRTEFKVVSTGNDKVNVKNNSTDSFGK